MTLLSLPSLVVWLAVNTAELPRTPMPMCGLFFSWLYNWKLTPMICSCHDLAKRLSHYLYFFSFLFFSYWTYNYKMEHRKVSCDFIIMSQWVWWMVTVIVTVCHMTRVIWGPWESKHIATVVKHISSRELSKNSIEFSLLIAEQRAVGFIPAWSLASLQ